MEPHPQYRRPWAGVTGLALAAVAAVAAVAALAPAALHAQEPLGEAARERDADRERCICFEDDVQRPDRAFLFRAPRARIGVMLGSPEEVGGETGVRVDEVVEGGPADRAGIAAGDVLLAFDGDPLGDAPTRALLDRMRDVEPGDTVAIRFSRDGRGRTARVIAEEDPSGAFAFRGDGPAFSFPGGGAGIWSMPAPDAPGPVRIRVPDGAPHVVAIDMFGHGGLELVEVNPRLGRYFGVEEGVLVADVAGDSRLGLEPGDVIVAIGDRDVRSPRHARSIIGSYLPDEEITFRVMRDRRTVTVRGTRGD